MELYEKIKKYIKDLEDYEKADLTVDLLKNVDIFHQLDSVQYFIDEVADPDCLYDLLESIILAIKKDITKNYESESRKKDDGYYNVKLHKLADQYELIEKIENMFNDLY